MELLVGSHVIARSSSLQGPRHCEERSNLSTNPKIASSYLLAMTGEAPRNDADPPRNDWNDAINNQHKKHHKKSGQYLSALPYLLSNIYKTTSLLPRNAPLLHPN